MSSSRVSPAPAGRLNVLPLGRRLPPSPADFVGSATVQQLVAELAATHEIVILDTPPLMPVSDSLTISEYADAALLVCWPRQKAKRTDLRRVQKLVDTFPTHILGFVGYRCARRRGLRTVLRRQGRGDRLGMPLGLRSV